MGLIGELASLKHRISVDAYRRMGAADVFAPQARVELIEGEIVDMAPIGSRHAGTLKHLARLLHDALGSRFVLSVQDPLVLGPDTELQPDLSVLRPRDDYYRSSHPTAADVLLLVEVSDSSMRYDRDVKIPLYARHGIPEVWLIDLEERRLHVHAQPHGDAYQSVAAFDRPGILRPEMLEGASVDLAGLF